jgi:acyl-CoA reductase-like NAD-dependent aldehyde dehydrogenase
VTTQQLPTPRMPNRLLIDGQWVEASTGNVVVTLNPATNEPLAEVAAAGARDVDLAIDAAHRALDGAWGRMKGADRAKLLWRIADLLEADAEELAVLETLDNGKPLSLSRRDDVPGAIEQFRYYAGWASKLEGASIPVSAGEYLNYTRREPVGIVAGIVPWNYPLYLAAWKLAPALATGNAVLLKPSSLTPLTALRLGEILLEAGLPAGAVSVLPGRGDEVGAAIVRHPDVGHISFTGSTAVGSWIMREASPNLTRISLELGGKSPNLIFADADLEAAISGAATAIYYNMGQDCAAGSRLLVERPVYEEVVDGLAKKAAALVLGSGLDSTTDQGPLVSPEQKGKVLRYLSLGQAEGARCVTGGNEPTDAKLRRGNFVRPTVLADVRGDMTVAREEIFGPVVVVLPFADPADAVAQGNDTAYGLGAGVWTTDLRKAHLVAHALKAGSVWVNCYNVYDPASPFGGYRQSGFGRESGQAALDLYTQTKSIWVNLEQPS